MSQLSPTYFSVGQLIPQVQAVTAPAEWEKAIWSQMAWMYGRMPEPNTPQRFPETDTPQLGAPTRKSEPVAPLTRYS
jgi:hypothetical protein